MFYTYLHCKPDGVPFYVGKGNKKRSHEFRRRNLHHKNIVDKYGKTNILIYVFPCETEGQAFADEIQQIKQLKSEGIDLANWTNGGEGASGIIRSKETRNKISIANKGKKRTLEQRAILSAMRMGNKWSVGNKSKLGQKCSDETKKKMSAMQKGKIISEDHKTILSKIVSNSIWITNGITNKRIQLGSEIPNGWIKGMVKI